MIFLPNSNSCPEKDFQLAPSHQPCFLKGNFMLCMLSQINCSPSFWELQSPVYWYLCCFCFVQIQIFCFERLCGVSCATVLWQLHLWDAWSSSSSVLKDFGAVVDRQQRPGGPQGRGCHLKQICVCSRERSSVEGFWWKCCWIQKIVAGRVVGGAFQSSK